MEINILVPHAALAIVQDEINVITCPYVILRKKGLPLFIC